MAEVIWTEPALAQLEAVLGFIALDKPAAATRVAQLVFAATDHLESFLLLGRPIPEFPHANYRQVWMKPCGLYYRVEENRAIVLHVRRGEEFFRAEDLMRDD